MSDNITREPYRNAWYKQLQEEVSKITPHLVPEVENDDNGKILVAGQEGTFDWAQPPEELPIITESDEGKVLKVDDGVPKWLEDKDSEYLVVNITESGGVYVADKTYQEILPFATVGKVVAKVGITMLYLVGVGTSGSIVFLSIASIASGTVTNGNAALKRISYRELSITQDSIQYNPVTGHIGFYLSASDGSTLSQANYNNLITVFNSTALSFLLADNVIYHNSHKDGTDYVFTNEYIGKKITIDSSRHITITSIPKLPIATSADEGKVLMVDANGDYTLGTVQGGSPHYAEVSLGISVE